MKRKTLQLGSYSEGTLKESDLIEMLNEVSNLVQMSSEDRKIMRALVSMAKKGGLDVSSYIDEMFTVINRYTPPYTYFGSFEGDAACIGVWIDINSIKEDIENGSLPKLSQTNPNYKGLAYTKEPIRVLLNIADGPANLFSFTLYSVDGKIIKVWEEALFF